MNSTAMQTNLYYDVPMLGMVNGHKVPIVDGIAMVLNADVTAAQAFGWTVVANQPPISEPTTMRPPPLFLMGPYGSNGPLESQFPDGTPIVLYDAPFRYESKDPRGLEKNCDVPAQWVVWAKAAWRWTHAPCPPSPTPS